MSLNLNLNLKKPIVFLKVATTGMEPLDKKDKPRDRIIEISITRIEADRKTVKTGTRLVNPGISIPAEATKINGITNEMVANMPTFDKIAQNLSSFIGDADFAGFSISNFDLKFLTEEFNRAGIPFTIYGRKIVDLSSIFNQMERRDFRTAASKFANHQLTDEPISSETANNIAVHILNGMVTTYGKDERFANANPDSLNDFFNRNKNSLDIHGKIVLNKEGRPVFGFGKYEKLLVSDILVSDPGYCDWCINASDLPGDTKVLIKRIFDKAKSSQQQNA
ncbi:MAG: exonuclease domain-containing protein [Nanoarchaeota archaeon]